MIAISDKQNSVRFSGGAMTTATEVDANLISPGSIGWTVGRARGLGQ